MKGLKKRTLIKETAAIDHSKGGREGMEEGKGYWREEKAGKGGAGGRLKMYVCRSKAKIKHKLCDLSEFTIYC